MIHKFDKFNESITQRIIGSTDNGFTYNSWDRENGKWELDPIPLKEVIGEVVEEKKVGYYSIFKTEKGCYHNLNMDYYEGELMVVSAKNDWISLKEKGSSSYGGQYYCYSEQGLPKIISSVPGDERGSTVFNNTFICSGHDGNYLWNINDPFEFESFTW